DRTVPAQGFRAQGSRLFLRCGRGRRTLEREAITSDRRQGSEGVDLADPQVRAGQLGESIDVPPDFGVDRAPRVSVDVRIQQSVAGGYDVPRALDQGGRRNERQLRERRPSLVA